jgi:hypothetical protein
LGRRKVQIIFASGVAQPAEYWSAPINDHSNQEQNLNERNLNQNSSNLFEQMSTVVLLKQ